MVAVKKELKEEKMEGDIVPTEGERMNDSLKVDTLEKMTMTEEPLFHTDHLR